EWCVGCAEVTAITRRAGRSPVQAEPLRGVQLHHRPADVGRHLLLGGQRAEHHDGERDRHGPGGRLGQQRAGPAGQRRPEHGDQHRDAGQPAAHEQACNASSSGTTPATIAARLKSRTEPWPPDQRPNRSVDSTPETDTSSPLAVDRNAANAPAATNPPNSCPGSPPSAASGSTSTTASALPSRSRCGTYTRPSAPYTVGNR